MNGIPDTAGALAELETIAIERASDALASGTWPADYNERLARLRRAIEIIRLASLITYFEASDTDAPR